MTLRLKEFVDKDLKTFSNIDNVRSIPSLVDGLKDSQRKAVYGVIDSGNKEVRVSQLASHASLITAYPHGETSMCDTIAGLAQSFAGSNNVNLLEPIGQFGSILSPEPASPRYIYTKPSDLMRKYIRVQDDVILESRMEDGDPCEPIRYYPVLPMWIVNGAIGIGTGHSVRILNRCPKKVAALVAKMVAGVNVQNKTIEDAMTPHFKGWKGAVVKGDSDTQWELHGVIEKLHTTKLRITELPVTYDVNKFKTILIALMDDGKVKDFANNSNDEGFDFIVDVPREIGRKTEDELKAIFKLVVKIGENVTLWDTDNRLVRYDNVMAALTEFVDYRSTVYERRRQAQIKQLDIELDWLVNRIAFTKAWNETIDIHKMKKADMIVYLADFIDTAYMDRLLSLQISTLTAEKIEELKAEHKKTLDAKLKLEATTPQALFCDDLKSL